MTLLNHQLELLSPARDASIGIEAINHGADAVYIGGPGFGARASAGNDIREIERLCSHAHRFNSRIFVTLNTILRDDELEGARQMAWDVYHAGADVLIVQDMGLLELDLPPIQLHASTQTDIRTVEKARFLQDVGFSQIVLARELTIEQIAAIHAELDAERSQQELQPRGANLLGELLNTVVAMLRYPLVWVVVLMLVIGKIALMIATAQTRKRSRSHRVSAGSQQTKVKRSRSRYKLRSRVRLQQP